MCVPEAWICGWGLLGGVARGERKGASCRCDPLPPPPPPPARWKMPRVYAMHPTMDGHFGYWFVKSGRAPSLAIRVVHLAFSGEKRQGEGVSERGEKHKQKLKVLPG